MFNMDQKLLKISFLTATQHFKDSSLKKLDSSVKLEFGRILSICEGTMEVPKSLKMVQNRSKLPYTTPLGTFFSIYEGTTEVPKSFKTPLYHTTIFLARGF